ncbi:Protein GrpE [Paraliobacillus sp. PM-2]|uniref:nucleotide exchange factor GrpE n=1 Tax=Paraliobacillus sp. PM-2 TaxID=1462524 RepID=UPI00061C998B|nr:nucleotide exchange factor GrpE [Paraliobacillus sp. PM-2]CQR46897.1 Protein GrpE [Paraliobacillus sp. PM-2]
MEKNKEKAEQQDTVEEVTDVDQEIIDESPEEHEASNSEVEKLQKEKDELYEKLLRVQAEYDNFRKRTQKEKEADRKYRSQSLITELLPVVDNFERALKTEVKDNSTQQFVEGMEMIYRQLNDVLNKEGVEVIETVGTDFDPHLHQAVMQVEDDQYDSNTVVEELQKGYKLKDRVIRPAMVKVNQ